MVSNASEDFPEPDRPVNTTSRSRGISRSTFFRLCSRAPRMVIARMAEPASWRFALMISSMPAIPDLQIQERVGTRDVRARIFRKTGDRTQWVYPEHRKNARRFPVFVASHQR